MPRVCRINSDTVNEPSILRLTDRQFRKHLRAAFRGEPSPFAPFIKIGGERPWQNEWAKIRTSIFERDNYTCTYCGSYGGRLQCDHIVPVAKGGSHHEDNLTTACEPCNRSKGAKLLSEWRQ
jgi:5-methylcytosine-specific restriction endonuclease McrA